MAPVDLQLPADLVSVAKLDQGDVSAETAKFIALALFRENEVSLGRAAELSQTPLEAFMEFAGQHGVPLHYSLADLEEDRANAERLHL
jgi:predicted HTH domain antitoxin